jgi:hypothetical protein
MLGLREEYDFDECRLHASCKSEEGFVEIGTATAVGKLVSIASNGREIVTKKTVITYRVKWQASPIQASSDSLLQCKSFPQLGITLPITKANPRPH